MLNKEAQDFLAASLTGAARSLQNLLDALDRSVQFYLPKHEEKWNQFNKLKNLLQLSSTGKETSVSDCLGVVLNTLEFDAAQAREAKLRYRKLAKVVHPDHNGSEALFKVVHLAYKSRDLKLLDILCKAVYEEIDSKEVLSILKTRLNATISQIQSKPAFKLLKLDASSGKDGVNEHALAYAESMLDKLIATLQVILLQGDKNATSQGTSN